MKFLKVILTIIVLSSAAAQASIITLESQWCCASTPGTLTFSYEDSTLDSVEDEGLIIDNNNPQVGSYQNAILSVTYVVNSGVNSGRTFSMLEGSSSSIIIRKYPGVFGPASVRIAADLYEGDSLFSMSLGVEGEPPLTDNLGELPLTVKADDTVLTIGSYLLTPILYDNNYVFHQVASVPEPAVIWLFTSGLVGLFAANRKWNAG